MGQKYVTAIIKDKLLKKNIPIIQAVFSRVMWLCKLHQL